MDKRKLWQSLFWMTVFLLIVSNVYGSGELKEVEVSPIRCWWKSDKSAVRVGESFNVVLTCRVIETENSRVVPNESVLDPTVANFSPFEVIGGEKYDDIKNDHLRFLQYRYELRIIGQNFGEDISIPGLEINYRIERKIKGKMGVDTREKIYKLPDLLIKIHSLVPKDAEDIRDARDDTFGDIRARRFYANIAFIAGGVLLIIPLVIFLLPLIRAIRNLKKKSSNGTTFSSASLLKRAIKELKKVKKEKTRLGWSRDLMGRTVSVFRIAGAIAIGHPINQSSVSFKDKGLEGQLKLRKGIWWFRKVVISASVTVEMMKKLLGELQNQYGQTINDFISGFETLNNLRYGPENDLDEAGLDAALTSGAVFLRKLKFKNIWLVKKTRSFRELLKRWGPSHG